MKVDHAKELDELSAKNESEVQKVRNQMDEQLEELKQKLKTKEEENTSLNTISERLGSELSVIRQELESMKVQFAATAAQLAASPKYDMKSPTESRAQLPPEIGIFYICITLRYQTTYRGA
jgi:regulator of replication initiation timing